MRVPATSANLGPGYDCLGLALALYDEVTASITDGPGGVEVSGEGAGSLPVDESHVVVASLRSAFRICGHSAPSVNVRCRNVIPQARGMGSSSAAIVAGVVLARHLMGPDSMDDADVLEVAADLEGHPDNVAPCVLGGFTIAWLDDRGVARAVRRDPVPGLTPVVYVPEVRGLTASARAALPGRVPHADAAFNVGRAALAVHAFTSDASLLCEATEDRLHQRYRGASMPESAALVGRLRSAGVAAMVSGAGPSVLAFPSAPPEAAGFQVRALPVGRGAHRVGAP